SNERTSGHRSAPVHVYNPSFGIRNINGETENIEGGIFSGLFISNRSNQEKAESETHDFISKLSNENDDSEYRLSDVEDPSPLLISSQFTRFDESYAKMKETQSGFYHLKSEEWKELRCEVRKLLEVDETFVKSVMRFAD
ncbi:16597_t:CDS:2, partial [Funneliformis caledonium]